MRVWQEGEVADGPAALCFDAASVGEPDLGHIVENGALQAACVASWVDAGGVWIGGSVARLQPGDAWMRMTLRDGGTVASRLVVGADGAQSLLRSQAHIDVRVHDYRQSAIVATVRTGNSHQATAWQRFLTTGPLALLPLADGCCSIVWSVDQGGVEALLRCSAEEFNGRLATASERVLGSTTLVSERLAVPLRSLAADSYIAPRLALIGDAAHVIHPLAGQGANLGILDAAALCQSVAAAVAARDDPGALACLRRYEQQRRTHNLTTDTAMSVLRAAFAQRGAVPAWLVRRGMRLVNGSNALKRLLAREALGLSGELPALARRR